MLYNRCHFCLRKLPRAVEAVVNFNPILMFPMVSLWRTIKKININNPIQLVKQIPKLNDPNQNQLWKQIIYLNQPLKQTAQITRANRDRKRHRQFEATNSKCVYEISPFPDHYEPQAKLRYYTMEAAYCDHIGSERNK